MPGASPPKRVSHFKEYGQQNDKKKQQDHADNDAGYGEHPHLGGSGLARVKG
jgi:hypothetical protein